MDLIEFSVFFFFGLIAPQLLPFFLDRIDQIVGVKFRLVCSIQKGSLPFHFQWYKNGIHILNNDNNDSISRLKIEFGDDYSNLILNELIRSDTGNYSCSVGNNYGFDQQFIQLNIQGVNF